jgi:hypothetical protein
MIKLFLYIGLPLIMAAVDVIPSTSCTTVTYESMCILLQNEIVFYGDDGAAERFVLIADSVPKIFYSSKERSGASYRLISKATTRNEMRDIIKRMHEIIENDECTKIKVIPDLYFGKYNGGTKVLLTPMEKRIFFVGELDRSAESIRKSKRTCTQLMANETYMHFM